MGVCRRGHRHLTCDQLCNCAPAPTVCICPPSVHSNLCAGATSPRQNAHRIFVFFSRDAPRCHRTQGGRRNALYHSVRTSDAACSDTLAATHSAKGDSAVERVTTWPPSPLIACTLSPHLVSALAHSALSSSSYGDGLQHTERIISHSVHSVPNTIRTLFGKRVHPSSAS